MKYIYFVIFLLPVTILTQTGLDWKQQGVFEYYNTTIMSGDESTLLVSKSGNPPNIVAWDVESGDIIKELDIQSHFKLDISYNGEFIAYSDYNSAQMTLYDLNKGSKHGSINYDPNKNIRALKILNNGSIPQIAAITSDPNGYQIDIFDFQQNKIVNSFDIVKDKYMNYSNSLYVSNDGRYLAYSFSSGVHIDDKDTAMHQVVLVDIETDKSAKKTVAVNYIRDIMFYEEQNKILLATGSYDNDFENVLILNYQLNKLNKLEGIIRPFYFGGIDKDKSILYALASDTLYHLSTVDLEIQKKERFYAYKVFKILSDERYLANKNFQVRLRDLNSKDVIRSYEHYSGDMHRHGVNDLAVSSDDKFVYSAGYDGTIKKWDSETGNFLGNVYESARENVRKIILKDDKMLLASQDRFSYYLTLMDIVTSDTLYRINLETPAIGIDVSDDNKFIAVGTYGGKVLIYEFDTGNYVKEFDGEYWIESIDISPDLSMIATAHADSKLKLWDFNNGDLIFDEKVSERNGLYSVKFALDNKRILIGSGDYKLKIFDIASKYISKSYNSDVQSNSQSIYFDVDYSYDGETIYGAVSNGINAFNSKKWGSFFYDAAFNPYYSNRMNNIESFNKSHYFASGDSWGSVYKWIGDPVAANVEATESDDNIIYPNPADNILNIDPEILSMAKSAELIDVTGRKVMGVDINNTKLDIEHLTPGVYYINLISEDGIKAYKFLKKP